jgi:WD40 repeat protein
MFRSHVLILIAHVFAISLCFALTGPGTDSQEKELKAPEGKAPAKNTDELPLKVIVLPPLGGPEKAAVTIEPERTYVRQQLIFGTNSVMKPEIIAAAFSAQAQLLMTSYDYWLDKSDVEKGLKPNDLTIWDVRTGEPLRSWRGHEQRVIFVGFLPDNDRVLSLSWDGEVKVWNLATGRLMQTFRLRENDPEYRLYKVSLSATAPFLFTQGRELWDVNRGRKVQEFNGVQGGDVVISPDHKWVAVGNRSNEVDPAVGLWAIATGRLVHRWPGKDGWGTPLALSRNNKLVLMADRLVVWDIDSRKELKRLEPIEGEETVSNIIVTPDSKQVVGIGLCIKVWDFDTGKIIRSVRFERNQWPQRTVAISPDGRTGFTARRGFSIMLWDIPNEKLRRTVFLAD